MSGEDRELIEQIERLAHEEHALFDKESRGEASTKERARLKEIEGELEACYDLLRARRARRAAGLDPDVEPVPDLSAAEEPTG
ncbi:MAG: DUF2630 family protein [Actinobacteria bacterium]|nr:DUF2630 family protein [Actinomycetota bacterium]